MKQALRFLIDAGWLIVFKDLNLSPAKLLKNAELPADLFSRKTISLTTEEYFRLWYALEEAINDPNLPLILGQAMPVESFNPPLQAAFCSPDLNECLHRLSRYKKLIGPFVMNISQNEKSFSVEFDCLGVDYPLPPVMIAMEFVFLVNLARMATRQRIQPLSVISKIPLDGKDYLDYFGVIPHTGDKYELTFSKADTRIPFLTENEPMWSFFKPELEKRLDELEIDATFSARVRSALLETLPSGNCTIADVAKILGISKRTLQRRLLNEETTFQKQLNHIREGLARHYLKNSDITNSEISYLVGYDDPNSFIRAFHVWTGKTPETYRSEHRESL